MRTCSSLSSLESTAVLVMVLVLLRLLACDPAWLPCMCVCVRACACDDALAAPSM